MWCWIAAALAAPEIDPEARALDAWRASLRADASADADADAVRWPGGWRVRVRPRVEGLPIDGASEVVALDPAGTVVRITGRPAPRSALARGSLTASEAIARAGELQLGAGALWEPRAREVAVASGDRLVHAWRVSLSTAEPVATWDAWIDATDGALLGFRPTSHSATGHVFERSPLHGRPVAVELDGVDDGPVLRGPHADVWSCTSADVDGGLFGPVACDARTRQAWPVNGGFAYAPNPGSLNDPLAEVNLYHHVTQTAAWFDARYGLVGPPLDVFANFRMANAFFGDFDGDGRGDLAFGSVCDGCDGGDVPIRRVQFAYDADVVVHEFGHWVVSRLADMPSLGADAYGLEWAGGALNEGAADVWAMVLGAGPAVGEYAGRAFGDRPIRELSAPRRCPDDLRGQVHRDGEILGALGWELIGRIGPELTSDLLFGAVATWGPDISWEVAGRSLIESAGDLRAVGALDDAQHAAAVAAIDASGMPGCGRVIPLDDGREVDPYVLSAGLPGELERIPGGTQFSVELVPSADRLVFEVRDLAGPDGLAWSLFARCGEPVHNEPTNLAAFGIGFSVPRAWDWLLDGEGPTGRLVIDASSEPPLPDGGTCYLAVAGRSTGGIEPFSFTLGRVAIAGHSERAALEPPPRGCATTGGGLLAAGLALILTRRRRRRGV